MTDNYINLFTDYNIDVNALNVFFMNDICSFQEDIIA
jgi:hypothetical protein